MNDKGVKKITIVFNQIKKLQLGNDGLTLIDLIVGITLGGIVLTISANGFINLLKAKQDIELKTIRHAGLMKALAYMQEDIKGAKFITADDCRMSGVDSEKCLILTYPDNTPLGRECTGANPRIYYGFQDISGNSPQIWLKPGILRRKIVCETFTGNWIVIADGLLGRKEFNPVTGGDFCRQDGINWRGETNVYGATSNGKGGFRFCLHQNHSQNRLVRIFLYGHIINDNPLRVNTIAFTRSQE